MGQARHVLPYGPRGPREPPYRREVRDRRAAAAERPHWRAVRIVRKQALHKEIHPQQPDLQNVGFLFAFRSSSRTLQAGTGLLTMAVDPGIIATGHWIIGFKITKRFNLTASGVETAQAIFAD